MRGVILDCDSLGPADLDLSALYDLPVDWTVYPDCESNRVVERIAYADIVLTNKTPIDAATLAQAPQLKLVSLLATGTNIIDLQAASAASVTVCNAVNYGAASVMQHVWGLILALTTNLPSYSRHAIDGTWAESQLFCLLDFPVRELEGKTLGVVGAGDLGSAVASVAQAFGMQVVFAALADREYQDDLPRFPLHQLLPMVDVLSLHCPLTEQTQGLIGASELALMKSSAILINSARGGLIDESALKQALLSGALAGAGLDVLSEEPPVAGNVLIDAAIPNLIITPHTAWAAVEARQRLVGQMVENITAFLNGEPLRQVN